MGWIENLDWGPEISWTEITLSEYESQLREILAENWERLVSEISDEQMFPSIDNHRYLVDPYDPDNQFPSNRPKFALELAKTHRRDGGVFAHPWGLNPLTNEQNSEDIWLTSPQVVGPVMEFFSNNSKMPFEEAKNKFYAEMKDSSENPVNKERLIELGLILFKKVIDNFPMKPMSAIENISQCVAFICNLTISRSYDGYLLGESMILQKLIKKFPELRIVGSTPEEDTQYNVDIQIIINDSLRIGIQVKPSSFMGNVDDRKFRNAYAGKVIVARYNNKGEAVKITEVYKGINNEISRLGETQ